MQGQWDGCQQPGSPDPVGKHLWCRKRLQSPLRPPEAIPGDPHTVLPSGTSRWEPGLQKTKNWLKDGKIKKKREKSEVLRLLLFQLLRLQATPILPLQGFSL